MDLTGSLPPGPLNTLLSATYTTKAAAQAALTNAVIVSAYVTPRADAARWTCDVDSDGSNVVLKVTTDASDSEAEVQIGLHSPSGFYDVTDYGAVGDGIADDTSAINAAVLAIGSAGVGGTLYFPPGIFLVTSSISLISNIIVQGDGPASVIKRDSSLRRTDG